MTLTREQSRQTFHHVLVNVLGAAPEDPLTLAMKHNGITDIYKLINLDYETLETLRYLPDASKPNEESPLPRGQKIDLKVLLDYHAFAAEKGEPVSDEDWGRLTPEVFDQFRSSPDYLRFRIKGNHKINVPTTPVNDQTMLLEAACRLQAAGSPVQQIYQLLHSRLGHCDKEALALMMERQQVEYRERILHLHQWQQQLAGMAMQMGHQMATSSGANRQEKGAPAGKPKAKRVRKYGEEDLAGRETIKDLPTVRDKVLALQALAKNDCGKTTKLTSGAKAFAVRLLRPAMRCLQDHFGGHVERFANHWEGQWNNEFSSKCCGGRTRSHLCSSSPLQTTTL